MSTPELANRDFAKWLDLGLHHWKCLARKYGHSSPVKLQRRANNFSPDDRAGFMRRVLRIDQFGGQRPLTDPWGNVIYVTERIIIKTLRNPSRTMYVALVRFAVERAIEAWHQPIKTANGVEMRRYYMSAITHPMKEGVVVIAGPDDVAFNVIGFDPRYAESLRRGTLLHSIYQEGAGYCRVHRCCDDIVEMERENDGLRFELAELRERLRRLNRDSANGRK